MPGKWGTNFLETEAILSAQEKDDNGMDASLSQMTEQELIVLDNACHKLSSRIRLWLQSGGVEL